MGYKSLCIAKRSATGQIVSFVRLMDIKRTNSKNTKIIWVYGNNNTPNKPTQLFNQRLARQLQSINEDYVYATWEKSPLSSRKYEVKRLLINPYTPALCYEIIICLNHNNKEETNLLDYKWRYSGRPPQFVFLCFDIHNESYTCILLSRDHLSINDNTIRLKHSTPQYVPEFRINSSQVSKINTGTSRDPHIRYIYEGAELPIKNAMVNTRSYACSRNSAEQRLQEKLDAILGEQHSDEHPKETTKRSNTSADAADSKRPADSTWHPAGENTSAEIKELNRRIQQKHDDLNQLEERIRSRSESYERLGKLVAPLQQQVDEMEKKLEEDRAAITSIHERKEAELAELAQRKTKELAELERQKDAVLNRLDEDVTLKLGLRSVVKSMMSVQTIDERTVNRQTNGMSADDAGDKSATRLHPTPYPTLPAQQSEASFTRTLADNLRSYGIVSVDKPAEAPNELASACTHILSATRLLAIDSAFAAGFANALAYAMRGEPARHVSVPADWNDACELDHLLKETGDGVLVLDGVFDTVNEGLLFALSRLRHDATIILPIGAYGNLRLIATEVWNGVFYLPTEQYVPMPVDNVSVRQSAEALPRSNAEARSILTTATSMRKNTSLPLASLMLPASVAARFRWPSDGGRWTSAHIALQTSSTSGPDKALGLAGDGEESTSAGMLLSRIGRGHDDR